MTRHNPLRIVSPPILWMIVLAFCTTTARAQQVKVEGLITQRHGDNMMLRTSESPNLVVRLTDKTEVGQMEGLFKARRKQMSMAALIPGLNVKVEGSLGEQNQVIAKLVKFDGDDLERAQSIAAGLQQTQLRAQQNQEDIAKQNAALKAQSDALQQQQAALVQQQT